MRDPQLPPHEAAFDAPRAGPPQHLVHATECLAGGTLGFLQAAVEELAQLGVRHTLVYARRPDTPAEPARLFPPGTRLVEVPPARGTQLAFVRGFSAALRAIIEGQPVHAVHLHSSKAGFVGRLAVPLARARTPLRPRLIYSPHGLAFLNRRRPLASVAYLMLERLAGQLEFQPVACGRSEAAALARVTPHVPFVLENPVEAAFFAAEHQPQQPPTVITAGRICEQKAPESFAELAVRVRLDDPDVQFVWVGDGEAESRAMLQAAGVTVTGWLPQAQVLDWMTCATLYVQCSRWEGLPLSVIQAMAVGLPCVVTDVVGNRDAVADGTTGFVVAGIDALSAHVELLLREPALRGAIGAAARAAAADRFGRARFRRSLVQLYRLGERAPASPSATARTLNPQIPQGSAVLPANFSG